MQKPETGCYRVAKHPVSGKQRGTPCHARLNVLRPGRTLVCRLSEQYRQSAYAFPRRVAALSITLPFHPACAASMANAACSSGRRTDASGVGRSNVTVLAKKGASLSTRWRRLCAVTSFFGAFRFAVWCRMIDCPNWAPTPHRSRRAASSHVERARRLASLPRHTALLSLTPCRLEPCRACAQ